MHRPKTLQLSSHPARCRDYLRAEVAGMPPSRPVYLLGESFGGLLAVAVAAELPDLVDRVVLVNPATR